MDTSRAGSVKRMQGFCARILNSQNNILVNKCRKFNFKYGCGELCWYLSPNPSMEQIKHYAPSYNNYSEDNYAFYGGRINHPTGNQLVRIANTLRQDSSSRRGVLTLWQASDLALQHRKDLPCTLTYKFNVCDGQLNMIADMRSNDAWLGFPNDVFVNTCIHILMCKLTGYDIGFYQHQVGDMHLYERDWYKATVAVDSQTYCESTPIGSACMWSDVMSLVSAECLLRNDLLADRDCANDLIKDDDFFRFILKGLMQ